jgi:hypothetical protein
VWCFCFCFDPRSDLNYPHTRSFALFSFPPKLSTHPAQTTTQTTTSSTRTSRSSNPQSTTQHNSIKQKTLEMPPKKTGTAAAKKDPEHPSYKDMITSAISTVLPPPSHNPILCYPPHPHPHSPSPLLFPEITANL